MNKTVAILGAPDSPLATQAAMSLLLAMEGKGREIRRKLEQHEDELRALWSAALPDVDEFFALAVKMGFEQDRDAFGRAWQCNNAMDEDFLVAKEEFSSILFGLW